MSYLTVRHREISVFQQLIISAAEKFVRFDLPSSIEEVIYHKVKIRPKALRYGRSNMERLSVTYETVRQLAIDRFQKCILNTCKQKRCVGCDLPGCAEGLLGHTVKVRTKVLHYGLRSEIGRHTQAWFLLTFRKGH